VTRLSLIDQEPTIGRYISELAVDRQYRDFFPLDDAADLDRVPFFYPDQPEPGIGPYGQQMISAEFRRYRTEPLIAYEFADVHLLGCDGVVLLDNRVVKNSLHDVGTWQAESNVEELRGREYMRLRRPMPVTSVRADGLYAIGFNGAWRNHGHWLPQSLPKLYAFTLLRRRFKNLKVVLPPLPAGSAQRRTLDLLGIGPEAIYAAAANEATCFASAILLPDFDIWMVTNFLSAAADALLARLPPPAAAAPARPDKVYVHRTVRDRNVGNFEALRPLLDRYGFAVVSFENMPFDEQIATMQAARHVISEHGAGTANILFCRPAARVLELFNPFCMQPAFWSFASRRGLDYGYLLGSHSLTAATPQPNWNSNYDIAPDKLEDAIRATLRLPPRPGVVAVAPSRPPASAAPVPSYASPLPGSLVCAIPAPAASSAAAAPTGGFAGIVQPIFEVVSDPARFGRAGGHERLPLFTPALPPPQQPVHGHAQMPPEFVAEHNFYPAPPGVAAYAIGGGVLWSTGLVTLGSQFVGPSDCLPGYFQGNFRPGAAPMHPIHAGAIGREDVKTITLERPVAAATHPNLAYGHAILEVVPRLWLLAVLREYGADIPLALSRTVPDFVKQFALLFHAEADIVWYDGASERVCAPSIVLPAMLHTEYNFHPALNLMVRDLVQRHPPEADSPKLIYLAQANLGDERLENQAEIEQAMRGLGFAVARLRELTPVQQIRLFAGAKMVVAEHGYALNAALFAPRGTRVVALNFGNHYQSAITRLRGHRIAYLPPADGKFRHWRLSGSLPRNFRVEPDVLRRVVQEMLQGV
jgi:capsular polysaccharide biosynthesis protein